MILARHGEDRKGGDGPDHVCAALGKHVCELACKIIKVGPVGSLLRAVEPGEELL